MIRELYSQPLLAFGCGNTLLGDDGFGPAVIEHLLAHHRLPAGAAALDLGTSSRDYLFDLLLSPVKPRLLIIIDAADPAGLAPGRLMELPLADIAPEKVNDFSLHQFPSVNLLQELAEAGGVRVRVLAVKAGSIPETVCPGLSPAVAAAVPLAAAWVAQALDETAASLEQVHPTRPDRAASAEV
ncbi:MAG: hydrogenase maturation protease [Pseudomonadota bacterium]